MQSSWGICLALSLCLRLRNINCPTMGFAIEISHSLKDSQFIYNIYCYKRHGQMLRGIFEFVVNLWTVKFALDQDCFYSL